MGRAVQRVWKVEFADGKCNFEQTLPECGSPSLRECRERKTAEIGGDRNKNGGKGKNWDRRTGPSAWGRNCAR